MTQTETIAAELLETCRASGLVIATAESCTGGLISGALTEIAGSSDVFDRGFVTYSNEAKTGMLGVDPKTIKEHGAVSEDVAIAMAQGAIAQSDATLSIAVTGVAGPGASDAKPEGMVWICAATRTGGPTAKLHQFGAIGRQNVRQSTVDSALNMLLEVARSH
jgi:nicotinamide-nucleotide amidase